MDDEQRDWFAGGDRASHTYHVVLIDARGHNIDKHAFSHSREGPAEMASWLLRHTGTAPQALFVTRVR